MAKLQLYRATEASVPTGPAHTGKVYFTNQRNLYVIDAAGNKIKFSDVIFETNEAAINGLSTKYQNKIYIALNEATMWFWNGTSLVQLGASNLYKARLQTIISISAATTALTDRDNNGLYACISSNPQEIEIPENSVHPIPIGYNLDITQIGAGSVAIYGQGAVALLGDATISKRYGVARVVKIDIDTWLISGDVA